MENIRHIEKRDRRERWVLLRIFLNFLKKQLGQLAKESWRDFRSIMEYTAFFVVIIYIFDQLIVSGLIRFINIFLEKSGEVLLTFFYMYERKYHG